MVFTMAFSALRSCWPLSEIRRGQTRGPSAAPGLRPPPTTRGLPHLDIQPGVAAHMHSRSNTGANRLDGNSDVLSSLLVVHVAWSSSRNRHLRHDGVGSESSKLFHEFLVEHLDTF